MKRRILAATVLACVFTARHGQGRRQSVFQSDDAAWGPGPSSAPAGAQLVGVVGDPTKEGS